MPAELVRPEGIAGLAAQLDSQSMLRVLRYLQQVGFIQNSKNLDRETFGILQRLADLGLIDRGYEGTTDRPPLQWVSNGNGSRVLRYLAGIPLGPHYEILSPELAAWLKEQGNDRWWNVDGDPLLTGRLTFPCPAGDLAAQLVRIDRPLLVQAKKDDIAAKGQRISREKIDDLIGHFTENLRVSNAEEMPPWAGDRLLYLRWKGAADEWLLAEDSETTEQMWANEVSKAEQE